MLTGSTIHFDLAPLLCLLPGHFTQVVWKDSVELGVGMATNGNKVFVVGQYRPAGNINTKEYFEKNVGPLGNLSVNPNPLSVSHFWNIFLLQTPLGCEAVELNFKSGASWEAAHCKVN